MDISDGDWLRLFQVNVMSGVPEMIHYGVTKSAQLAVSRGLAEITKGTRVTVNAVMPGPTRSDGIVQFLRGMSTNALATDVESEGVLRETPLGVTPSKAHRAERNRHHGGVPGEPAIVRHQRAGFASRGRSPALHRLRAKVRCRPDVVPRGQAGRGRRSRSAAADPRRLHQLTASS